MPRAAVAETDLDHFGIDNDPGVHPVALGMLRMRQAPQARVIAHDAAKLVIGLERIAPCGDEVQHPLPGRRVEPGKGEARPHFGEQRGFFEGPRAGAGHDVLGQDIEPAGAKILSVALPLIDGVLGGGGLEKLEPVARHQHRSTWLIEAVIGAADALEQAARPFRRSHLHHAVDVAPIDAEVEAGGGDQGAQFPARHRPLNLAPRFLRQRAVMDADRQGVLVGIPQLLEDQFGEEPGIGEDQRRPALLDEPVELRNRPDRRVSAPRHARLFGQQDLHFGRRAPLAFDQLDRVDLAPRRQPGAEALDVGDRGGKCGALKVGGDRLQPAERQRQQVAALAGGEGVDLVDHHPLQAAKQVEAVGIAKQQREAFGRGQQDMWRARALALLAIGRRIAAAGFDADRQAHLLDGSDEVALHVVRQRLER